MPRQVVLLLVDGIRPDILRALRRAGDVPSLDRLFGDAGGSEAETACSVFPSTTGPAHLPFLTGRYPGACNVPGIRWFDPERYAASRLSTRAYRSYIGPGTLQLDRDLSPDVRTIYELVADHATAGGSIRRGVRRGRNLTRWSKLVQPVVSYVTERWDRLDRLTGLAVARAVSARTAFVFGAFYAADSCGHKFGPGHEVTLEAYRRIDGALAGLAAGMARRPPEDRPLVLLVSDHGQSATSAHLDLHRLVERVVGPCLAHPIVLRGLTGAAAAVMVSGNAMAHVYVRGRGWGGRQPLDAPAPEVARLLEALLAEDAVDQVMGASAEGGAVVVSRAGRAQVRQTPAGIEYRRIAGADPFGYPAPLEGTRTEREWLRTTWDTEYPDAPVQVLQILRSPRAGHLMVTARPGWDLRARFEKPRHVGSHGALHREHMMTPLLSTEPLAAGPKRTVDLFPTVVDALGLAVPSGLDGRSLWNPV